MTNDDKNKIRRRKITSSNKNSFQNIKPAICIRNVNKYDKKNNVYRLKNVNLSIPFGRFVMVMGVSGAGKSTLFKAILEDLDIDSGKIEKVGNKIGYVPQGSVLRTGNSVQDLMEFYASKKLKDFSKKDRQQSIDSILKKLNLLDLKNHLVGKLSGGQSRRLNVAVQLLDNPNLILLDEPDSGLDMESNKELYSILANLVKERNSTILIISHMTYMAYKYPYVDDLLFMASQGRICFYGPKNDAYNYFGINDFDNIYKTVKNNQNYFINKYNKYRNDKNYINKKNDINQNHNTNEHSNDLKNYPTTMNNYTYKKDSSDDNSKINNDTKPSNYLHDIHKKTNISQNHNANEHSNDLKNYPTTMNNYTYKKDSSDDNSKINNDTKPSNYLHDIYKKNRQKYLNNLYNGNTKNYQDNSNNLYNSNTKNYQDNSNNHNNSDNNNSKINNDTKPSNYLHDIYKRNRQKYLNILYNSNTKNYQDNSNDPNNSDDNNSKINDDTKPSNYLHDIYKKNRQKYLNNLYNKK